MPSLKQIFRAAFSWLVPSAPSEITGVDVTKASTDAYINVGYGHCYGTGQLAYQATNDADNDDVKNDLLHRVVIWSEGHCGGVINHYIDDDISTSSRFTANNGGKWFGFANFPNGMGSYSDPLLTASGRRVADTFEGKFCSYLRCEMTDGDVWSGEPNHKAEFNGRLISAPTGGAATASENPVDQEYDLLKSSIYGKGLSTAFIDVASFTAARAVCNTLVETYPGSGVNRKLFTSNIILDTSNSVLDNVNILLKSMRGLLFHSNGKLKILVEKDDAPVDFTLDESDRGFIEWGDIANSSKSNRYNRVICRYTDPDSGWTTQEVVWPEAGSTEEIAMLAEDNGVVLEKSITLDTCIYYHEAAHHAKTICLISREQLRTSITWGPEAVILEVGDILPAIRSAVGWDGKLFRIESTEKSTLNGTVELKLREHQPYIYDDANAGDKPVLPDTNLAYTKPATPTNGGSSGVYNNFTQVQLYWDSTTLDHSITISDSDGNILITEYINRKTYQISNLQIGTYTVNIRAFGGLGRSSDVYSFVFDIEQPPTSVNAPDVVISPGAIVITPDAPSTVAAIYEGLYTTNVNLNPNSDSLTLFTVIPAGKSLAIINPTDGETYFIWYRLKTIEGGGNWLLTTLVGVGLDATRLDSELVALMESLSGIEFDADVIAQLNAITLNDLETNNSLAAINAEIEAINIAAIADLAALGSADIKVSKVEYSSEKGLAIAEETQFALVTETEARAGEVTRIESKFDQSTATINQTLTTTTNTANSAVSIATSLNATVSSINANYATQSYANASASSAAAGTITTIDAKFDQNTGVYGVQIKTAADAANAAASAATSLAAGIYDAQGNLSQAFIDDVSLVAVEADGQTIAASIASYSVSAGGSTFTLSQLASASISADGNSYAGQWGVQTNINNLTYGVGFYVNNGVTSFVVNANNFVIKDPSSSATGALPFVFSGGQVYIDDAKIQKLNVQQLEGDVSDAEVIDIPVTTIESTTWQKIYDFTVTATNGVVSVLIPRIDLEWFGGTGTFYYHIGPSNTDPNTLARSAVATPSDSFLPGYGTQIQKGNSGRFVGWVRGDSSFSATKKAQVGGVFRTPLEIKVIQRGTMITVNSI
jgi:hypothetical protein